MRFRGRRVRETLCLGIGNGAGKQARSNQPPYRRYGPDTEIQHRPRKSHGLAKPSRILSKREADTEFRYRPHIVDTHIDCGCHFCGRHFRDSYFRDFFGISGPKSATDSLQGAGWFPRLKIGAPALGSAQRGHPDLFPSVPISQFSSDLFRFSFLVHAFLISSDSLRFLPICF